MKKFIYIISVIIVFVLVLMLFNFKSCSNKSNIIKRAKIVPVHKNHRQQVFTFKKNSNLTESELLKIEELENLGYVPMGSGSKNMFLAQYTSWWGQPLDPTEFWDGEVIWFDSRAQARAEHYGRKFPPIPTHVLDVSSIATISNVDDYWLKPVTWKHADPNYVLNGQERTFWLFRRHLLPRPPAEIDRHQFDLAKFIMGKKNRLKNAKNKTTGSTFTKRDYTPEQLEQELNKSRKYYQKKEVDFAFPSEPFQNQETLFYCYIDRMRKAYQSVKNGERYDDRIIRYSDLNDLWQDVDRYEIDRKLITDDLDPDFVKRGTAWQTNYLTRLRNEGWDESYIEAYKKAWDVKNFE